MGDQSVSNKVAVVGIGETQYYKRGAAPEPEFVLVLRAIQSAARDAGIDVREIDGFASYSSDRNEPLRTAAALGIEQIRFANMVWGGGGGGVCAAVANAAAGLIAGYCRYAVVYRGLAQGQFYRFGQAGTARSVSGVRAYIAPYGLSTPAQVIAMHTRAFMERYGMSHDPLAAVALVSKLHAQRNPRALMFGRPITREDYDNSRWIVEPFRLFDCCLENDGAAALILTLSDRARDLVARPAYLLAAAQGSSRNHGLWSFNGGDFPTANFKGVAPDLYQMAGIAPKDVDVAQIYENFTGAVVMSLVEHGFCAPEEVDEFCTVANLKWDGGGLPMNTSGGNLAECYMHGLGLVIEAVRQVRGTSSSQVEDVNISLVAGGPTDAPVSSLILRR
jgi:acetyl-CoA acetyltransferase